MCTGVRVSYPCVFEDPTMSLRFTRDATIEAQKNVFPRKVSRCDVHTQRVFLPQWNDDRRTDGCVVDLLTLPSPASQTFFIGGWGARHGGRLPRCVLFKSIDGIDLLSCPRCRSWCPVSGWFSANSPWRVEFGASVCADQYWTCWVVLEKSIVVVFVAIRGLRRTRTVPSYLNK